MDYCLGRNDSDYFGGLKSIFELYYLSDEFDMEIESESENLEIMVDCVFEGFYSCELYLMIFDNNSVGIFDLFVVNVSYIVCVVDKLCKVLDKVMMMLIWVWMLVRRLLFGGYFLYNVVFFIVFMENVEKFYDGCWFVEVIVFLSVLKYV